MLWNNVNCLLIDKTSYIIAIRHAITFGLDRFNMDEEIYYLLWSYNLNLVG